MNTYGNQPLVGQIKDGPPEIRTKERPAPEIEVCFANLESAVEKLMKTVSGLSSKVQPVCRASDAVPIPTREDRATRLSGVAERINLIQDTICSQIEIIEDLCQRVEL